MFRYRSQAKFVDKEGRLMPEAYAALARGKGAPLEFTAQSFVADDDADVYLQASQNISLTRGDVTVAFVGSYVSVSQGDTVALAGPQAIVFVPR